MRITKFTILGERCSGTNYLEELIIKNFNLDITWEFGWKHFFGFNGLKDSDETLFIGIVRNPYDWIGSLHKRPHHIAPHLRISLKNMITSEWWSYYDQKYHKDLFGKEIVKDRNFITGDRYKNIFEMRSTKAKYLLDTMPKLVKNYILIRYEELRDKPSNVVNMIANKFKLSLKSNKIQCVNHDIKSGNVFQKKEYKLSSDIITLINNGIDKEMESRFEYILR